MLAIIIASITSGQHLRPERGGLRSSNTARKLATLYGAKSLSSAVSSASFRGGGATPSVAQTPHRRLNELTMIGNPPPGPLAECQGDCDGDQDCQVCNVISYH